MPHRTDQTRPEPTPVTDDATAAAPQLLARAAADYAAGWGRPHAPATSNEPGSAA